MKKLLWDIQRPSLKLMGPGVRKFIQGQTTGDFLSVKNGDVVPCCWLTATGRVRALLEIRIGENIAEVLVLAGDANELAEGFEKVIFPADKLELNKLNRMRRIELIGNDIEANKDEVFWLLLGQSLPDSLSGFRTAKTEEVESWRLKRGLPIGPGELNGENNPFELGLADWINLDKGCYLGQETLAKLVSKKGVKQQLRFWQSESSFMQGEVLINSNLEDGMKKKCGVITSAIDDRENGGSFGLAMVSRKSLDEKKLFVGSSSQSIFLSMPSGFVEPPYT